VEFISNLVGQVNGIVWGVPMLVLILGTGLFLMVRLGFMPLLNIGLGFKTLWNGRKSTEEGDISPFNALMTSLSATVGTGNIAGVATAIFLGGPGAVFWMWCTALVGMATKYSEAVCAVKYREVDEGGNHIGGPMYYIKNGLGSQWAWLGGAFAFFGMIAGFGIGNGTQVNSMVALFEDTFGVPKLASAIVVMILVGLVLLGGIKRIGEVAGKLVPLMAIFYVVGGVVILAMNASEIPAAFGLIFHHAFNPTAAVGGFAGAGVAAAIQFGVARGVFSNEAGLGSAPIAHAAAKTNNPVQQGIIAMLGTFIDTIIICTITALVIITSGAWTSGASGAVLSSTAFETSFPGVGSYVVTLGLAIFAFTTILGWSFYGEKCVQYLFGYKSVKIFRVLWVLAIPIGALVELKFIWLLSDTLNAFMALPNLIALLLLSPVVIKMTKDYFAEKKAAA